jgi:hypothetical protein
MSGEEKDYETFDWGTPSSLKKEHWKEFEIVIREAFAAEKHSPALIRVFQYMSQDWVGYLIYKDRTNIYYHQCYIQLYRPILRYKKVVLLYKYLIATMGVLPLPRDLYPVVARFLIY